MTNHVDPSKLKGLHKDTKALIQMAHNLGWKPVQQASGAIRLLPPEGHDIQSIRIPLSTKPFSGMARARKIVMSTASGASVASLAAYVSEAPGYNPEDGVIQGMGADDIDLEALVEPEEPPARRTHHEPEPYVVATAPWMARKAPRKDGGLLYESNAVRARTWSDGTVDYVCAEPGCNWSSTNPVSVARHYGGAHSRGKGEQPQAQPTEVDPDYTEPVNHRYTPTDRLVGLLAEQIRLALAAGMDPADMAKAILTWQHDRPDIDHVARDVADLSPEQILDRIRLLLGRDPLAQQLEESQKEVAEMRGELDAALHEIRRLTDERQALRDLLS